MTAYFGINIGVFVVSAAMTSSSVGAGLGLGLLGVLSIIRLRSDELSQREVAYYFASLAIGLLGGLAPNPIWIAFAGMALVVVTMFVGDNPRIMSRSRNELIVVDRAIPDETELRHHLESLLGATVKSVQVQRLDLVNDSTWVDVRYVIPATKRPAGPTTPETAVSRTTTRTSQQPATPATEPTSAVRTHVTSPRTANTVGATR